MDASNPQKVLADFLIKQEGSTVRAWIHKLDPDHEHRITEMFFLRYMRENGFPFDPNQLWHMLDGDGGGEITFAEIDPVGDELWERFRMWACETYPQGAEDCVLRMSRQNELKVEAVKIDLFHFEADLVQNHWQYGQEESLFRALCANQECLVIGDMRWLNLELRRLKKKLKAKEQAHMETRALAKKQSKDPRENLADFKRHLRQKHGGSLVRAWRQALTEGDAMLLHKGAFFKACVNLKWRTDVKGLWEQLDRDGSGAIGIEELDFRAAEELALFRQFVINKFENATRTFAALDLDGNKNVSESEFMQALKEFGYESRDRLIFQALDKHGKKKINLEDILFLDHWKPLEFLLASANYEAADAFKKKLRDRFGSHLRGWKMVLDVDGSNTCNWEEFRQACKRLGFKQDVAGAWRALDSNMSGTISLSSIDPASSTVLLDFRNWAVKEFGSVKSMFTVFDEDNSKSLSLKEFKRACRIYGFRGHLKSLFNILESTGSGGLTIEEVVFLDRWANLTVEVFDDSKNDTMTGLPTILDVHECGGEIANLGSTKGVAQSLEEAGIWKEGDLHPAFKSWANRKRRRPVKKQDGSLPALASQVDLGTQCLAPKEIGTLCNLLFAEGISGVLINEFPVQVACASCWRTRSDLLSWYEAPGYQKELVPLRYSSARSVSHCGRPHVGREKGNL